MSELQTVNTLYHYTSLDGILGIIRGKKLWATHFAHLNDSTELDYSVELLTSQVADAFDNAEIGSSTRECLRQLMEWLGYGHVSNHLLFTCSFTEAGNLLSQWRAYSPPSGGISIGFDSARLNASAGSQGFTLVKCVYNRKAQHALIADWLISVLAAHEGQADEPTQSHPSQSYHRYFRTHEDQLLYIAARLKNPAFSEEREWRLISGVIRDLRDSRLRFRAGKSRLIPYIEFTPPSQSETLTFRRVYIGPAQDHNIAFQAIATFLTNSATEVTEGIHASGIPLRNW